MNNGKFPSTLPPDFDPDNHNANLDLLKLILDIIRIIATMIILRKRKGSKPPKPEQEDKP